MEQPEEYVNYLHRGLTDGPRFEQRADNPIPRWAYDVRKGRIHPINQETPEETPLEECTDLLEIMAFLLFQASPGKRKEQWYRMNEEHRSIWRDCARGCFREASRKSKP